MYKIECWAFPTPGDCKTHLCAVPSEGQGSGVFILNYHPPFVETGQTHLAQYMKLVFCGSYHAPVASESLQAESQG